MAISSLRALRAWRTHTVAVRTTFWRIFLAVDWAIGVAGGRALERTSKFGKRSLLRNILEGETRGPVTALADKKEARLILQRAVLRSLLAILSWRRWQFSDRCVSQNHASLLLIG